MHMLKKITLGSVAIAITAMLAAPAQAQLTMQPVSWDANAGVVLPMGDLGDVTEMGFGVAADGFLWTLDSMPELHIGGRLAVNMFGEKEYDWGWGGGKATSDATIIEFVPTARYIFPSSGNMTFFGQAGLGLFHKSVSVDTGGFGSADDSETDFGITLGGGVSMLAGGVNVFAMPLLHLTGDNYVTLSVGALFGGK